MSIFDDDSVRDKELEESILVAKFLKEFQEVIINKHTIGQNANHHTLLP